MLNKTSSKNKIRLLIILTLAFAYLQRPSAEEAPRLELEEDTITKTESYSGRGHDINPTTQGIPKAQSEAASTDQQAVEVTIGVNPAAISEDLSLDLVDAFNPALITEKTSFSGSLTTSQGVIDSLEIRIDDVEITATNEPMTGNTFLYEFEGERFYAMIYQTDQFQFMVTITTGPYTGTRFVFQRTITLPEEIEVALNEPISDDFSSGF